eukprot:4139963-Pyramimonas_sp.AAC.1
MSHSYGLSHGPSHGRSHGPSHDDAGGMVDGGSEPGAWAPALYSTTPCPPMSPPHKKPRLVIGRTTFETDRCAR